MDIIESKVRTGLDKSLPGLFKIHFSCNSSLLENQFSYLYEMRLLCGDVNQHLANAIVLRRPAVLLSLVGQAFQNQFMMLTGAISCFGLKNISNIF